MTGSSIGLYLTAYLPTTCPMCPTYSECCFSRVFWGYVRCAPICNLPRMCSKGRSSGAHRWFPGARWVRKTCAPPNSLFLRASGYVGYVGYVFWGGTGEKKEASFQPLLRQGCCGARGGLGHESSKRLVTSTLRICLTRLFQNTCVGAARHGHDRDLCAHQVVAPETAPLHPSSVSEPYLEWEAGT